MGKPTLHRFQTVALLLCLTWASSTASDVADTVTESSKTMHGKEIRRTIQRSTIRGKTSRDDRQLPFADPLDRKSPSRISKKSLKLPGRPSWKDQFFTPSGAPSKTIVPSQTPSSMPTTISDQRGFFQPFDRPIRVACVGDSLTRGRIGTQPGDDFPSQLQRFLGDDFDVRNYGVDSVTAIRGLGPSYDQTRKFQESLRWDPDIYLIMLGTNDSKFWEQHGEKFAADMEWIIQQAQSSTSTATRVMLAIPPWVKEDVGAIRNDIVENSIRPELQGLAQTMELQLLDVYSFTDGRDFFFLPDNLHLNVIGYKRLAEAWKFTIACNQNGICEAGENCSTCASDCFLNCP